MSYEDLVKGGFHKMMQRHNLKILFYELAYGAEDKVDVKTCWNNGLYYKMQVKKNNIVNRMEVRI